MTKISINQPYITLGQLLKITDCINSGGQAKFFLYENQVLVNDEPEQRRGKKLYSNDRIEIEGFGVFFIE